MGQTARSSTRSNSSHLVTSLALKRLSSTLILLSLPPASTTPKLTLKPMDSGSIKKMSMLRPQSSAVWQTTLTADFSGRERKESNHGTQHCQHGRAYLRSRQIKERRRIWSHLQTPTRHFYRCKR